MLPASNLLIAIYPYLIISGLLWKELYYSVLPEENEYRPNLITSKKKEKDYKNTVCKLILGMFILSVGLSVADYFLMEQKLLNSIKNVLPQDNLTNLIIGAYYCNSICLISIIETTTGTTTFNSQ